MCLCTLINSNIVTPSSHNCFCIDNEVTDTKKPICSNSLSPPVLHLAPLSSELKVLYKSVIIIMIIVIYEKLLQLQNKIVYTNDKLVLWMFLQ